MDMKGTWSGTYEYNLSKEFEKANKSPVAFTIKITNWENSKFTGTVEDDLSKGGTPGIGEIAGVVKDVQVSFTKKMPIAAFYDENGNSFIEEDKKHATLYYKGMLADNQIKGSWRFKNKIVWFGIIPRWYKGGNGTFSMNKTV
jgi:hypothetical protein